MRSDPGSLAAIAKIPQVGPRLGRWRRRLASRSVRWYVDGKSTERSMKVFRIAAVMGVLPAPAYAQMSTPNINPIPGLQSKNPEEKEQEAQQKKAPKENLKKIPDPQAPSQPPG